MPTKDDTTKRAVLYLLRRGATFVEAAKLSGRSRQLVRHWAKDLPETRAEYLRKQWERAVARFSKSS